MTLEALVSNEPASFLVYDTIDGFHQQQQPFSGIGDGGVGGDYGTFSLLGSYSPRLRPVGGQPVLAARKKKRRRTRRCRNKEVAESQRMTHITVERNRRRQMNEHLSVLRSLMPESYINRGDQASIVGGAIDYVKELEQLLQSLEAQKRSIELEWEREPSGGQPPFAQFFTCPQYAWWHAPRDVAGAVPAVADVEVTLVEKHANLRILSPRRSGQLVRVVAAMHAMRLTVLHLNVTTLDPLVLYSFSAKVEEGCNLTTVDDIAGALHHMLTLIEAESLLSFGG